MTEEPLYAIIDYEDDYVQPLILAALRKRLPPELVVYIDEVSQAPSPSSRLLQWRQYESIDFDCVYSHPSSSLCNSYIIRKALIRKHYLSATVSYHLTKHPDSVLKDHVKPSVELELDYAEFLDEALVEAWDLKQSWARNAALVEGDEGKEWWILKPSMSERGQGIRLFSSEEELEEIFQAWDPESEDEDEDEEQSEHEMNDTAPSNGIITSHLRHFVAQPYIHPPLLLPSPHPSARRKFHIRTYVLAVGALQVYVYKPMLALFAGSAYTAPDVSANENLESHLTNTCLQSNGEREGSVYAFWSLPSSLPSLTSSSDSNKAEDWRTQVFEQICSTTREVFLAAATSMSTHFQLLPNAFEIFALDFLLDERANAWLLEVNAFPDFKQTGEELKGLVQGLFEGVVEVGVMPFFLGEGRGLVCKEGEEEGEMRKVLDIDLGRR